MNKVEERANAAYPFRKETNNGIDWYDGNAFARTIYREGYMQAEKDLEKYPTLRGWAARDENGVIHLFEVEPRRMENKWWDRDYNCVCLPIDAFPSLKWEDDPIEVELIIKTKDE